jgi:predicted TPR repeat methyltransferase
MDIILHNKSLQSECDKKNVYNHWAETYEEYVSSIGYKGPPNFACIFTNMILGNEFLEDNQVIKILDFGCGTGLLGLNIRRLCQSKKINIKLIGIDISDNMIQQAENKGVYDEIWNMNLLEMDIEEIKDKIGSFDYIVSCGVFLEGHVGFEIFEKFKEMVEYNIIFTARQSYIIDEYINYVKYVKKDSYNYKETDIEYLDNIECKLIII